MRTRGMNRLLFSIVLCFSLGMPSAAQTPTRVQNWLSGYNPWFGEEILGSHWVSSHEMVTLIPGTLHLTYLDINTGRQAPLDVINSWVDHRRQSLNGYGSALTRLSPNGKWLLWPSGDAEKPTWIASTLDGAQSREWPRHTSIGNPAVAWMQDSTHWVELSMAEVWATDGRTCGLRSDDTRARVYSLTSSDVQEFPLQMEKKPSASTEGADTMQQVCFSTSDFSFTTDGHAWVTSVALSDSIKIEDRVVKHLPTFPEANCYQILPGPERWALRATHATLGPAKFWKPGEWAGIPDFCYRSPDNSWLLWQHRLPRSSPDEGVDQLILCRIDGSEQQIVYQGAPCRKEEWMPGGHGFSFVIPVVPVGISETKLYTVSIEQMEGKRPFSQHQQVARHSAPQGPFPVLPARVRQVLYEQLASRSKVQGKYPTALSPPLMASQPLLAIKPAR